MSKYDMMPCDHRNHVSYKDCSYAHERMALEATIIRGLIRGLKAEGWLPISVYTDEQEEVHNETETMDAVHSVDESTITFAKDGAAYGVLIIKGNGIDVICDYNVSRTNKYGWNDTIDRITDELMEKYDQ